MLLSELKTALASHGIGFYRLFLSADIPSGTNVAKFVARNSNGKNFSRSRALSSKIALFTLLCDCINSFAECIVSDHKLINGHPCHDSHFKISGYNPAQERGNILSLDHVTFRHAIVCQALGCQGPVPLGLRIF